MGIRRNVEIFRDVAKNKVADASANKVGLVTVLEEPGDHL